MKIAMLDTDWKDGFLISEMKKGFKAVGDKGFVYVYSDHTSDANILFFSSHQLTQEQLDRLWILGDFCLGDHSWVGKTFDEILKYVREYIDELETERERITS